MNVYKGKPSIPDGYGQSLNARVEQVSKPTETLLFADCGMYPTATGVDILDRNDVLAYTTNWNPTGGTLRAIQMTPWLKGRIPRDRHGKKINVAFCDGHGETVGEQDWDKVRVSPWKFETPPTPAPVTW
jgi:prepilin-type processing-associated H-X9-DG protein